MRDALLKGGDSGASIVPGKPDESPLLRRLTHEDDPGMPYKKDKLSAATIALFRQWILEGAPYDRPLFGDAGEAAGGEMIVKDSDRRFWSFAPLRRIQIADDSGCRVGANAGRSFHPRRQEVQEAKSAPEARGRR